MLLKNLTDEQVEQNLLILVEKERTRLTDILYHIIEVEDRKIYLKRSFKSLHEYCEEVLKYPGDQAYRRIAAAQLLRECPIIKKDIESGGLNVTLLGQAKTYFNYQAQKDEHLTHEEKCSILSGIAGKSTRHSEKIFAELNPDAIKRDQVKIITQELAEIRFVATENLMQKLQRFKDLDSHTLKDPNYNDLFERLVDLALAQKEKMMKPRIRAEKAVPHSDSASVSAQKLAENSSDPKQNTFLHKVQSISVKPNFILIKRTRAIPIQIKREVYLRDEGKCTFTDPLTGRRCGSQKRIQYDHLQAFSLGGEHSATNLTLRCQAHNLFSAERLFGQTKMREFQGNAAKVRAFINE